MSTKSITPLSTALELLEDQVQITLTFRSEGEAEVIWEVFAEAIRENRLRIDACTPTKNRTQGGEQ